MADGGQEGVRHSPGSLAFAAFGFFKSSTTTLFIASLVLRQGCSDCEFPGSLPIHHLPRYALCWYAMLSLFIDIFEADIVVISLSLFNSTAYLNVNTGTPLYISLSLVLFIIISLYHWFSLSFVLFDPLGRNPSSWNKLDEKKCIARKHCLMRKMQKMREHPVEVIEVTKGPMLEACTIRAMALL
jgi:hypothetical protein